jgi:hypothetical protein
VWPHPISVAVGGKAISIGCDAPEVVAALDPWRILDVGGPIDYCLELYPTAPGGGKTRPLPGLYHGSMTLLRSRDPARLTSAFLRVLGSYTRPAGPGQIRIALMPVVLDGAALLAPPASIGALPDRWILAQGIEALHTVSSLIDIGRAQVVIDPVLGSDDDPGRRAFRGWWLPSGSEGARSAGFAVAEAMKLVSDITAANAVSVLRAVATLVERVSPAIAPGTPEATKALLAEALQRSGSP